MKNKFFLLLFFTIPSMNCFCQTDGSPTDKEIKIEKADNAFNLPKGSKILYDKDNNLFNFELNENYIIVGTNEDGLLNFSNKGTISCECTKGYGCNPFIAGGGDIVGCTTSKCQICSMKSSISISSEKTRFLTYIKDISIIEFSERIHFVSEKEELLSLKNPNDTIMSDKWFISEIEKYGSSAQTINIDKVRATTDLKELDSLGYIMMPINAYGYLLYIPVEKGLMMISNTSLNTALKYMSDLDASSGTCVCNKGNGCVRKSKNVLIGSAVWCEANACNNCTLKY